MEIEKKLAKERARVESWRAGVRDCNRKPCPLGREEAGWEDADKAGEHLVKMPGLPIVDALISEQAAGLSTAVASDDYHLRALGAKPVWYKR